MTAHVLDQSSKVAQAQAGVMLRDGRGAASVFAMMFVAADGTVHFRYRNAKGDVPSEVPYAGKATWMEGRALGRRVYRICVAGREGLDGSGECEDCDVLRYHRGTDCGRP